MDWGTYVDLEFWLNRTTEHRWLFKEKLFLTENNLKSDLNRLEKNMAPANGKAPELEVTEMSEKTLSISVKNGKQPPKEKPDAPGDEIEVVHEKELPKLQSILKQRSRTMSESSDDCLSSSGGIGYSRENSTNSYNGSESPISESEENEVTPGRKKSVSFSEYVDKTTFKATQSVSSMRSTLKNKRRRQRKKEQTKQGREARRKRRISGSECSSDDMSSSQHEETEDGSQNEDVHDDSEKCSKGTGEPIVKPGSVEASSERVSGTEVKSPLENGTEISKEGGVKDGEKKTDILDERTSKLNEKGQNGEVTTDGDDVIRTRGESEKSEIDTTLPAQILSKEDTFTKTEKDDVTGTPDSGIAGSPLISEMPAERKEKMPAEEDDGYAPETMLSWKDAPEGYDPEQFKTKCAFDFSNTMMFELDED